MLGNGSNSEYDFAFAHKVTHDLMEEMARTKNKNPNLIWDALGVLSTKCLGGNTEGKKLNFSGNQERIPEAWILQLDFIHFEVSEVLVQLFYISELQMIGWERRRRIYFFTGFTSLDP